LSLHLRRPVSLLKEKGSQGRGTWKIQDPHTGYRSKQTSWLCFGLSVINWIIVCPFNYHRASSICMFVILLCVSQTICYGHRSQLLISSKLIFIGTLHVLVISPS
jgi:hypothetical protein